MIQFDEANLSNSSLKNIALVNEGIGMKQHSMTNFTTTFLQNGSAQPLDD